MRAEPSTQASARPRLVLLAATALAACSRAPDAEVEGARRVESALTVAEQLTYSKTLDPEPSASAAADALFEHDMVGGRLTKLPVSPAWFGRELFTGAHTIRFRAQCAKGSDPAQCNPVLFARQRRCADASCAEWTAWVGASGDSALAGGVNQRGAYLSLSHTTRAYYDVVVANKGRATPRMNIAWSLDGTSWSTMFSTGTFDSTSGLGAIVGGAIVRLGALQSGDSIAVSTPGDGNGDDGTRMWLFRPSSAGYAFSDPVDCLCDPSTDCSSGCDLDPAWGSSDASFAGTTYAVLGKDEIGAQGRKAMETMVTLSHLPIEPGGERDVNLLADGGECAGSRSAPTDCASGDSVAIGDPENGGLGRYIVSLYATAAFGAEVPFGQNGAGGMTAPMDQAGSGILSPILNQPWLHPCPAWDRGDGNDLAFTVELQRRDGSSWVTVASRHVPRALLGTGANQGWNRITLPLDVTTTAAYRVRVTNNRVRLFSRWRYVRNAGLTEIKLAHVNVEYDHDDAQTEPALRNLVDLLATRGDYSASEGIQEPDGRNLEWEADVVVMNEILPPSLDLLRDELEARTEGSAVAFEHLWGAGKWLEGTGTRFNPVFVNQWANRDGDIEFSAAATGADCHWTSDMRDDDVPSCKIRCEAWSWNGFGIYQQEWGAVPARLRIDKGDGDTKRVALFSTYLPHGSGPSSASSRSGALVTLMQKIDALMSRDGCAFNAGCSTSPTDHRNRFIIAGDLNGMNHQCGEFADWVETLRNHYGYAVDVSSVQLDRNDRTMDMHYSSTALDQFMGEEPYEECGGLDVVAPWETHCVENFAHKDIWATQVSGKYSAGVEQRYPWWAATSAGAGESSRLDAILLVGRGWAYDDPVVLYKPMASLPYAQIGNGYDDGAAVEIGDTGEEGEGCSTDLVPSDSKAYRPRRAVCGEASPQNGGVAFLTDHKPIGVRLRLWSR